MELIKVWRFIVLVYLILVVRFFFYILIMKEVWDKIRNVRLNRYNFWFICIVYIVVVGVFFLIDVRRYVILREVGYLCMVLCI